MLVGLIPVIRGSALLLLVSLLEFSLISEFLGFFLVANLIDGFLRVLILTVFVFFGVIFEGFLSIRRFIIYFS